MKSFHQIVLVFDLQQDLALNERDTELMFYYCTYFSGFKCDVIFLGSTTGYQRVQINNTVLKRMCCLFKNGFFYSWQRYL